MKILKVNNKGFSLLELSIVLTILTVILSFTAPLWMNQRISKGVEKTVGWSLRNWDWLKNIEI